MSVRAIAHEGRFLSRLAKARSHFKASAEPLPKVVKPLSLNTLSLILQDLLPFRKEIF